MSQEDTFDFGDQWGYPKTANVACRRTAFEEVGGFREEIRAAEDADLTYRLRAAGWEVERREHAAVVHASRTTLRGLVPSSAGARAAPGWTRVPRVGARWWAGGPAALGRVHHARRPRPGGAHARPRRGDLAVIRPLEVLAWEFGRLLPNRIVRAAAGDRRACRC